MVLYEGKLHQYASQPGHPSAVDAVNTGCGPCHCWGRWRWVFHSIRPFYQDGWHAGGCSVVQKLDNLKITYQVKQLMKTRINWVMVRVKIRTIKPSNYRLRTNMLA